MKAVITDIKRLAVHDGDGIRTTVFFKGCPLRCLWCHNPESLSARPQLAYYAHRCVACGSCAKICRAGAHAMTDDGGHVFSREKCVACGACTALCAGGALQLYGKSVSEDELLKTVLRDRAFYENSGGGVTLSGGECLLQADFCASFLRLCRENGLNTAVDTCGDVPREAFDKVMPYTNTFLYDVKAVDPSVHEVCTGRTNGRILENLRYLDSKGARIEIRYPYVPGKNDGEAEKIARLTGGLSSVVRVRVLPYHDYARAKYAACGIPDTMPEKLPSGEEIKRAEALFVK